VVETGESQATSQTLDCLHAGERREANAEVDGGAGVIVLAEDEVVADQFGYVVDGVCRPVPGCCRRTRGEGGRSSLIPSHQGRRWYRVEAIVDRETFDRIKEKHGPYASWAVFGASSVTEREVSKCHRSGSK
jgi:hypothetical protein